MLGVWVCHVDDRPPAQRSRVHTDLRPVQFIGEYDANRDRLTLIESDLKAEENFVSVLGDVEPPVL